MNVNTLPEPDQQILPELPANVAGQSNTRPFIWLFLAVVLVEAAIITPVDAEINS